MYSLNVSLSLSSQGQKAGLHLDTNGVPQPTQSVTAPPNLQPFFDDMSDSESQSNLISSLKVTAPPLPPLLLIVPIIMSSLLLRLLHSLWTSLTFSPFCFFSFLFIPSPHPRRERRCVRLTTGTHCSPLPLPNPTPPFLLSAPKYVLQHVFSFHLSFSVVLFLPVPPS